MTDPNDPTEPTAPAGSAESSLPPEEQAIRERVRELTAQLLAGGRLDTESVTQVMRSLSGGSYKPPLDDAPAREAFAQAIGGLAAALQSSAQAAQAALQTIATRGKDFSDNDVKNAFAALEQLQQDYVAVTERIADATSGNLRREFAELTLHAQRVGADAGVRIAQMASEFANRLNGSYRSATRPGLGAVRQYGANMSLLTSGLLAGFADALLQQAEKPNKAG